MTRKIHLSPRTRCDIEQALDWTLSAFGEKKRDQYIQLIGQALDEIAANPNNPGSRTRADLHPNARAFHIGRRGKRARHLFVYMEAADGVVEIARLLHDSMDARLHVPEGFLGIDPPTDPE